MIGKKLVDRYAHQSGVKDQLVAEREVVLTHALGLLRETKGKSLGSSRNTFVRAGDGMELGSEACLN